MRAAGLAAIGLLLAARGVAGQMPIVTALSTQQNPPGIRWFTIESPHFRVVFPDSLEAEAQRAARLLESSYDALGRSLRRWPEPLTVVLNNEAMTSNAFVAWSPRRSVWYALPNATVEGLGAVDWYRLLAVHEGRHVVQERATRTGWIGLASRLLGDNTTGALAGNLYFPAWFWEGDAVGLETALTPFGRGRLPAFTARTRALAAAGERYGYYPAWQGSYRTIYPDWYEHGYVLTTHVRRRYGADAWGRAIRRAAWNPFPPWALSSALKHVTGRSLTQLHRDAIAEIDSLWRAQRDAVRETAVTRLSPPDESWHAWSQPQMAADGSVIAVYSDLTTIPQLVRLEDGERRVLVPRIGFPGENQFHVSGDRVVWAEQEVDPRWGERTYLVLKRLDLASGAVQRLTDRTRLFGPKLSPDGRTIVAVEFSRSRRSTLVLLDAETGRETRRLPNPENRTLLDLAWAPDGRSIYAVHVDSMRGNALLRLPLEGGAADVVIDYTTEGIARPVAAGSHVYFGSPRSGLDMIWAVDTATRSLHAVASRPFGAHAPSVTTDGRALLFADYTAAGLDVVTMPLDSRTWTADRDVSRHLVVYADSIVAQEARLAPQPDGEEAIQPPFPVTPYGGWSRLFDFHSIALAPTSDGINTGLVLESHNMLNTLAVSAGAVWNTIEGGAAFEGGLSYAGLPVILDAALRLGNRASTYTDTAGTEHSFQWQEQSATLAARLPLTRLAGRQRQSLTASAAIGLTEISDQPVAFRFENNNGRFAPVTYALSASHARAAAFRDLFATGASASLVYRHTPFDSPYRSHILAARAVAVAPTPVPTHALVIDASHQEQRRDTYEFGRLIGFPRGFRARYHDRLSVVGASYHLPLFYPDLALGPLVYSRRVQGALFADVGEGSDRTGDAVTPYRSVGVELTTDLAFFGTRSTTRLGVRFSQRLTGDRKATTEFLVQLPQ